MALYRNGTASMDAQGNITGTGTKWKEPLSLIRTGATIVFLTSPIKLAVINTIVSDTSMTAISTDGSAVPNGNYVILLSDSLTVDGMAQDVAETLRYYQGKETQIEEALEFFENFDLQQLIDLKNQTQKFRNDAEGFKNNAASSATAANNAKTGAETARNQAQSAQQAAASSAQAASGSATTASQKATAATNEANRAKGYADSLQPNTFMKKDQNLADLLNKVTARYNLEVPFVPRESLTASENLNTKVGYANVGFHLNAATANATPANNYPVQAAGVLVVLYSGANGANEATQIYHPYNADEFYKRRGMPSGSTVNWTSWVKFEPSNQVDNRIRNKLDEFGLNTTGVIAPNNANDLQRNGFFAGAGEVGVNYARQYAPGIVMRRVNDVYQAQLDDNGRWIARFYTPSLGWGNWNKSVIEGDYGVGYQYAARPTVSANSFFSENDGGTLWAASNGAGFQACYDPARLAQFMVNPSGNAYCRWLQTGNPQTPKSQVPWNQLQIAGTSDERVKDIKGSMNIESALDNINRMDFKLFKYTFDSPERSARRGVIAQQVMKIDKEYVHINGNTPGMMCLDLNPLVTDSMAAIKALRARDVENKERISKLESEVEDLKKLVADLLKAR